MQALAFRSDGQTLAVTARDYQYNATVTMLSYAKLNSLRADPARYACAVTGRGLTSDEWRRFVPELPHRQTCPR